MINSTVPLKGLFHLNRNINTALDKSEGYENNSYAYQPQNIIKKGENEASPQQAAGYLIASSCFL